MLIPTDLRVSNNQPPPSPTQALEPLLLSSLDIPINKGLHLQVYEFIIHISQRELVAAGRGLGLLGLFAPYYLLYCTEYKPPSAELRAFMQREIKSTFCILLYSFRKTKLFSAHCVSDPIQLMNCASVLK